MTHIPGFIKDLRSDAQALQEANGFDRDGRIDVHLHAHDVTVRAREARLVLPHSVGAVKLT